MSARYALAIAAVTLAPAAALAWEPLQACDPDGISHWSYLPAGYRINEVGSDNLSIDQVESILATAWSTWESVCCATWQARYDGRTTLRATDQAMEHVVSFEETEWPPELGDPSTVLAVTQTAVGGRCVIEDADLLFNGVVFVWVDGQPEASNEADFQSVATHEQGHWLGLGHSAVESATMYPTYDNALATRTLDADDEMGVCAIYTAHEGLCTDDADDDCDGAADCADTDCLVEPLCTCTANATLACGDMVGFDSSGGLANLDTYPCAAGETPGPEVAHSFAPTFNGSITLDLSGCGAEADPSLYVAAGGCTPSACVGASTQPAGTPESLTLEVAGGTVYYVVVDSPADGVACSLQVSCVKVSEAVCDNGSDDDDDTLVDCDDSDCEAQRCAPGGATCVSGVCVCPGAESAELTCDDTADNDCDGFTDCADADCDGSACDADGRTCFGNVCQCPGGATAELTCDDGQDNDCDLEVDCADEDCFGDPCGANGRFCALTGEGTTCVCPGNQPLELGCSDSADNDCDGTVDCADADCEGILCGGAGFVCDAGDCVCQTTELTERTCDDSRDNDCDTFTDCGDPDCAAETTEQFCDDELDNDCDEVVDCEDPDCDGRLVCAPANELDCDDDRDDDFDDATDCADSDCAADPACVPQDDGPPGGDPEPGGDPVADTTPPPEESGGCGCRGSGPSNATWLAAAAAFTLLARRRSRRAPARGAAFGQSRLLQAPPRC